MEAPGGGPGRELTEGHVKDTGVAVVEATAVEDQGDAVQLVHLQRTETQSQTGFANTVPLEYGNPKGGRLGVG